MFTSLKQMVEQYPDAEIYVSICGHYCPVNKEDLMSEVSDEGECVYAEYDDYAGEIHLYVKRTE